MRKHAKVYYLPILFYFGFAAAENASAVTCEQYDQVSTGMSRAEVVKLLGDESEAIWGRDFKGAPPAWISENGNIEFLKWKNRDKGYLQVGFKDGKVINIVGSNLPGKSMKNPAACRR